VTLPFELAPSEQRPPARANLYCSDHKEPTILDAAQATGYQRAMFWCEAGHWVNLVCPKQVGLYISMAIHGNPTGVQ
jgi:hypothetical protein